ncbi:MAG TPA: ATP-binding protein [Verrucomicrobiota bacterium]|nr:ATP-binding protein [Verrucomicrobiota bacterium]HNU49778.1 ATP-binding protein [Verrucomicrobiota bacterium]
MTIRNRLALWIGGILLASLVVLSGVIHYEWVEQQRLLKDPRNQPMPAWEEVGEIILFYGLPTTVLLLVGTWWLLGQSLAPITSLTRAAERIHIHNLHERLPMRGTGDELDRLTVVFNSMVARLEESFTHIREFTLGASHELKTPLTVMRLEIETALRDPATPPAQREVFADQLEQVAHVAKIVDSLTLLAKADAGQLTLAQAPVRLDDLVRDSVADAQLLAGPGQITVELEACDEAVVQGDCHRLRQLLLNLTDNAIKYNAPRGFVKFALRRDGGLAELRIANGGPGIAREHLTRIFDRFFRGDPAHSGTIEGSGLGLSIAQWIVRAHGGEIHLASQPGIVTTVTVRLPLAVAPDVAKTP